MSSARGNPRAVALCLTVVTAFASLALPAAGAAARARHRPHRIGLLVAGHRAKETAARLCETLDDPPPCHVIGLKSCKRLAARKAECNVVVRFPEGNDDCSWAFYVFWRHSEVKTSEGRSECHETDRPRPGAR